MARATSKKGSPIDEDEFLQLLYRGGELLAAGKVIEAKEELEKAYAWDAKNEKCQNLLGLTYFKLGLFDRASEIYEALVRENPADPTLRVNLGLVHLKTNALQRAIREFETATDLAPEHKKAQNYLGLALAQAGEYGRAREHFLLAGSEAMAEKMTRAIAGEGYAKTEPPQSIEQKRGFAEIEGSEIVAERGGQVVTEAAPQDATPPEDFQAKVKAKARLPGAATKVEPAPKPVPERPVAPKAVEPPPAKGSAADAEDDWGASFEDGDPTPAASAPPGEEPTEEIELSHEDVAAAPAGAGSSPWTKSGAARTEAPTSPSAPAAPTRPTAPSKTAAEPPAPRRRQTAQEGRPPVLAEYAVEARVFEEPDPARGPFQIREDSVAIVVQEELLTRLTGLLAYHGSIEFSRENKRVRGRTTDRPFGEGGAQLTRARGRGAIAVSTGTHQFFAVELGDESAYFREEVLFAFEEALSFENGRVPCQVSPDLELVHLRGKGKALLALSGPLRSLEVRMDRPATVPLQHLVGWHGNLMPKVVPLLPSVNGQSAMEGVELSGEGFALFSAPLT